MFTSLYINLFSSHGTRKLNTNILQHTKKYISYSSDTGTILINLHLTAIVLLAVVTFLFDLLREKRSVSPTK